MANGTEPVPDLVVRPIEPADTGRLLAMFHRLSAETIYRRFFTLLPSPPPAALRRLVTVDHHDREALVAVHDTDIVAVARWDRIAAGSPEAEIAVVVEDAWQHRGLGHFLMRRLVTEAAQHGITFLTASVLTDNRPAMRLAQAIARPSTVEFNGPETKLGFALAS